ncbi:heme-binding beta-barrel domain-containing protein [Aestuariirhabdus sp. Z084]|uniref:heme-binding beta-barrel domain-containing protein n=1 Tax=Aestuariirhabdus haliotis TaxID=2918751 RepID=UPI00201B3E8D|nr:heme-binding beta-barrel domain-containing protein [Aestuariirhabdus haliotis]MCL6414404.1 heme-binding beta-barrel domain-containing protein [Aestuariirhabdus haliotis]MCL6418336.1 heme-binding beta-barrel domain-containing protein [Aestuariirhabdus haliotis]
MSVQIDDVDYGPLTPLLGRWHGDRGMDRAPEPDGIEQNEYYETLLVEAAGLTTNAEEQELVAVRYHQLVSRKSNDKVFHNETGYWMWEPATGLLMQSYSIPRGISVLAGGEVTENGNLQVRAELDHPHWGIVQSPFMAQKAKVLAFDRTLSFEGEELVYEQNTLLDIYGAQFDHRDNNRLQRSN